jgi:hypothetical protein
MDLGRKRIDQEVWDVRVTTVFVVPVPLSFSSGYQTLPPPKIIT